VQKENMRDAKRRPVDMCDRNTLKQSEEPQKQVRKGR
jgi:hypothetical protein